MTTAPPGLSAPPLFVVAAAMVDARGRVLVQQRPPGKAMAGLWEFPGGKVEAGETPEAALARELREELGVAAPVDAMRPCAFASAPAGDRHLVLLLYTLREWAGEPRPLEASALRWETPAALRKLTMPPADVPLVQALEARLSAD